MTKYHYLESLGTIFFLFLSGCAPILEKAFVAANAIQKDKDKVRFSEPDCVFSARGLQKGMGKDGSIICLCTSSQLEKAGGKIRLKGTNIFCLFQGDILPPDGELIILKGILERRGDSLIMKECVYMYKGNEFFWTPFYANSADIVLKKKLDVYCFKDWLSSLDRKRFVEDPSG